MFKTTANTALAYLREIRNFIKWIFTEKIGILQEYFNTRNYHSQKCIIGFIKDEVNLKKAAQQVSCNYNKKYKAQKRSDKYSIEESEEYINFVENSKNSHAEGDSIILKLIYNYGVGISAFVKIPDNDHFTGLKREDLEIRNRKAYMTIKYRCKSIKPIRITMSDYNMIINYYNKNSDNQYIFNCTESYPGKQIDILLKPAAYERFDKYKKECENIGIIRKGLRGNTDLLRKAYKDRIGYNADDIERRIDE